MRCLVDSIPVRSSSANSMTYFTESTLSFKLSSTFLVDVMKGQHFIQLQWKTIRSAGRRHQWLIVSNTTYMNSLSATAGFDSVWHTSDTKDKVITTNGVWQVLSDNLHFEITTPTAVVFIYSATLIPLVSTKSLDRRVDSISTRFNLDGTGYTEGSDIYGINSWNPTAANCDGMLSLTLPVGNHTLALQWMKQGTGFRAWGSTPSLMDGYASARNLIVLTGRETFQSHLMQAETSTSADVALENKWSLIPGSVLTFELQRQSAVLFTFAVPATQRSQPTVDSNLWRGLPTLQARLWVDGAFYSFDSSSAVSLTGAERVLTALTGSVGIVAPAGRHSAAIQWRASNAVEWQTLNEIVGGEQLLAIITSEDETPSVILPDSGSLMGYSDSSLGLGSVQLSVARLSFSPGILVSVNLTVSNGGLLSRFNGNSSGSVFPVTIVSGSTTTSPDFFNGTSPWIYIGGPLNYVNTAIAATEYWPPPLWFGESWLNISLAVTDITQIDEDWTPLVTSNDAVVKLLILPVDHPFTLEVSTATQIGFENETTILGPIMLNDVDNPVSNPYRASISASCGVISLSNLTDSLVKYYDGLMAFEAYLSIKSAFSNSDAIYVSYVTDRPASLIFAKSNLNSTAVTVYGDNFNASCQYYCQFNEKEVDGFFVSESQVICVPPWMIGAVNVSLIECGETVGNTTIILSSGDVGVFIDHIFPSASLMSGGATVKIHGSGFLQMLNHNPSCLFGDMHSAAALLSDSLMTCVSPRSDRPGYVHLNLKTDGGNMGFDSRFLFLNQIVIEAVRPQQASVIGGAEIVISGGNYPFNAKYSCLFGNSMAIAWYKNSSAVVCVTPATKFGSVYLHLLINDCILNDFLPFKFIDPAIISNIFPIRGPVSGTTAVSISGTGFKNGSTYQCLFGRLWSGGMYISSSKIVCSLPPQDVQDVILKVYEDDSILRSTDMQIFSYIPTAVVTQVSPSAGTPLTAGSGITVFGFNLATLNIGFSLFCVFGNQSTTAILVSDDMVSCATPSTSFRGSMPFFLQHGDYFVNSEPFPFLYLDDIAVTQVFPSQGVTSGGTELIIIGGPFLSDATISCNFNGTNILAWYINSTAVECMTPSSLPGYMTIELMINDLYIGNNTFECTLQRSIVPTIYDIFIRDSDDGYTQSFLREQVYCEKVK
ncbi:unnamed protein product [Sphagnum jensenii]|uniref:IPT/TIG domain-containing protein n=1 Tax=Sphagnum jensenii TaxID=128206 RepID=A0ABP0V9H9_9BRYO